MDLCLDIIVSPMERFAWSFQRYLPAVLVVLVVVIVAVVIGRRKRK